MKANTRSRSPRRKTSNAVAAPAARADRRTPEGKVFSVVGVGASAGGLEAFSQLLAGIPADTGMAFVLILHLDPLQNSYLAQSLAKATAMPVVQAQDRQPVEPNHVYVIPPNADLSLVDGRLKLQERVFVGGKPHLPVDAFFRSLAADRGSHAIGVVLSGTAWDGTEGLRAIKEGNGITLAQSPKTAKFDGMPNSAVGAGVVDLVLPIPEMALELIRLGGQQRAALEPVVFKQEHAKDLAQLASLVLKQVGVDFGEYKAPTFERRLARRMALRQVTVLSDYVAIAESEPAEVQALSEDVLIHVTSFFRDPEVFAELKSKVFPRLLASKAEGAPLRVWVAGCSSGEEVYSLAMALLEFLDGADPARGIQIFGTDVSEKAIAQARLGYFPDSALRDVSDDRRRRYFVKTEGGYTVHKAVRDLCVFVRHDLARDPPFSRLDMVSCRNVLIYFDTPLQQRVLSTFHYALEQNGVLLLGRAESISGFGAYFSVLSKVAKVFARSPVRSGLHFEPRAEVHRQVAGSARPPSAYARRPLDLGKHVDAVLLARYAPPGVLVNEKLDVLQYRGDTGAYLRSAPGQPQNNVLKMARGAFLAELRATLASARTHNAVAQSKPVNAAVDGPKNMCVIVVMPFAPVLDGTERMFVVTFEPAKPGVSRTSATPRGRARRVDKDVVKRLEEELVATREYIQTLMEDHDRADDVITTTNEELISGNEELQSMNEELETAKEELQSTNEELTTVNDELQHRNHEVSLANSDLVNLLETFDVPVVILDAERRIRRLTPKARSILNVVASDVGRPLEDIRLNIRVPNLDQLVKDVIEGNTAHEAEVQDTRGSWYRMRIRPYRNTENRIDGATLSMVDIDALKDLIRVAQDATAEAERANRAKDQFLANLSHELRTPLSAISLHAQRLQREASTPEAHRAGDAIERGARLMAQLIDDLLDVSRIVSGKLKLDTQPVDLGDVVRTVLEAVQPTAARKNITLNAILPEGLEPITGDPMRLQQVVSNLLTNAVKFTPPEGQVDVTLTVQEGWAHLRVKDSGIGISPTFLPHVFNRFSQEEGTTVRRHGGLGLGLAIVRHLVEAHGGAVKAESPGVGQGATFSVSLPLASLHGDEHHPGTPASGVGTGPAGGQASKTGTPAQSQVLQDLRILIVDDDAPTREVLTDVLEKQGAHVRAAESAADAGPLVEAFRPQVLVCDVAMPGEDGHAFLRRLRAMGADGPGNIPALALTAFASAADRAAALASGFQMHMAKPVNLERLTAALRELASQPCPLGGPPAAVAPARATSSGVRADR